MDTSTMPPRSAIRCYQAICEAALVGKPWLVTERRTVTFGELRTRIEAMAGLLRDCGVGPGQRVVIASRDDAEASMLFVALLCNGVTVVNLDPETSAERAQSLIRRADCSLQLLDRELAEKWSTAELPGRLLEIVSATAATGGVLGKLFARKSAPPAGLHGLLAAARPGLPPDSIDPESLAYILFTSGTTDQPKGVCISHRALFAHLETLSRVYGYDATSRILNILALSHADGMLQGPVIGFFNTAAVYRRSISRSLASNPCSMRSISCASPTWSRCRPCSR